MGTQQFFLKWNNHQSNLINVFDHLLTNEALVDVTLACEGLSLKAHKIILSACSPFFQNLFLENPCKHPIFIMKDIKYAELKAVIDFMYKGETNISHHQLSGLLKIAEMLNIKGLVEVADETEKTIQNQINQNYRIKISDSEIVHCENQDYMESIEEILPETSSSLNKYVTLSSSACIFSQVPSQKKYSSEHCQLNACMTNSRSSEECEKNTATHNNLLNSIDIAENKCIFQENIQDQTSTQIENLVTNRPIEYIHSNENEELDVYSTPETSTSNSISDVPDIKPILIYEEQETPTSHVLQEENDIIKSDLVNSLPDPSYQNKQLMKLENLQNPCKKKRKIEILTLETRIKVIKESAFGVSLRQLAEKFNCGKTQISNILQKKDYWLQEWELNKNNNYKRKRKQPDEEINKFVWDWFQKARDEHIPISGSLIKEKAREFAEQLKISSFQANKGWLDNFRRRHNIREKRKIEVLTLDRRIKVIKESASGLTLRQLAEKFNCGKTQILNILKKKDYWLQEWELNKNNNYKRKIKQPNEEINKFVLDWIQKARDEHIPISGPLIQEKAREFAEQLKITSFRASNGWLDNFRRRHNIVFRSVGGEKR